MFCGLNILTEVVFAAGLSSNVGISVWGIVWVTKKLLFQERLAVLMR